MWQHMILLWQQYFSHFRLDFTKANNSLLRRATVLQQSCAHINIARCGVNDFSIYCFVLAKLFAMRCCKWCMQQAATANNKQNRNNRIIITTILLHYSLLASWCWTSAILILVGFCKYMTGSSEWLTITNIIAIFSFSSTLVSN